MDKLVCLILLCCCGQMWADAKLKHPQVTRRVQAQSSCSGTPYVDLCVSSVASIPNSNSMSEKNIVSSLLSITAQRAQSLSVQTPLLKSSTLKEKRAIRDCQTLLDSTLSSIHSVAKQLSQPGNISSSQLDDMQTFLSAAMTNQDTCLEGFNNLKMAVPTQIASQASEISKRVSNALAMLKKCAPPKADSNPRRGLFPMWVSKKDEVLLKGAGGLLRINLTVAQDGSGNFTTINAAVAAAPNASTTRFVIYIKTGIYSENVEVGSNKTMIMFIGDGKDATVIRGNRSVVDNSTTFYSSTVAVTGGGFLAKGVTFVNDAGAVKYQAVALRVGADFSVFYGCSFKGYQDTLYVHSFRQFFRNCDIYGTVDFIFGNAAVVFQNCNLYPRLPMIGQKDVITAQGRYDPNQNTGISIINCKIARSPDIVANASSFKTFLGRPWKMYSRTVYLKSYIGDLIDAAGWLPWNGTFALDTLYYAEYLNTGPGSNTSLRVNWTAFCVINTSAVASQFSVRSFIQGERWIGYSGVPYVLDL